MDLKLLYTETKNEKDKETEKGHGNIKKTRKPKKDNENEKRQGKRKNTQKTKKERYRFRQNKCHTLDFDNDNTEDDVKQDDT